jgi:hypothetical protein
VKVLSKPAVGLTCRVLPVLEGPGRGPVLLGETGENILDVACCTTVVDIVAVEEEEEGPACATDPELMAVACDDDPALLVDTVAWLDEGNSGALKQKLIQQN